MLHPAKFADTTRLALSSYDLWKDILATNAPAIDAALAAYIEQLQAMRERVSTTGLADNFTAAAAFRRKLG